MKCSDAASTAHSYTRSSHSYTKPTAHSLLYCNTEQPGWSPESSTQARDGASTKTSSYFEAVLRPWRDAFFRLQRPDDGGCVCLWTSSFVVPGTHARSGCGCWRERNAWSSQGATATGSVSVGSHQRLAGDGSNEPFRWRSSGVEYEGLERFRPRGVLLLLVSLLLRCLAPCYALRQISPSRGGVVDPSALYGKADVSTRRIPGPGNRQYLQLRLRRY